MSGSSVKVPIFLVILLLIVILAGPGCAQKAAVVPHGQRHGPAVDGTEASAAQGDQKQAEPPQGNISPRLEVETINVVEP